MSRVRLVQVMGQQTNLGNHRVQTSIEKERRRAASRNYHLVAKELLYQRGVEKNEGTLNQIKERREKKGRNSFSANSSSLVFSHFFFQ